MGRYKMKFALKSVLVAVVAGVFLMGAASGEKSQRTGFQLFAGGNQGKLCHHYGTHEVGEAQDHGPADGIAQ